MVYDPEGPVAKQLTPLLVNELTSTYGIPDDAQDVAEYINVLIGNNRSAADICTEVKDVVNIPIDEAFVGRVFAEISRLSEQQQQPEQQPVQPVQQPQQPQQMEQVEQANPFSTFPPAFTAFPTPFEQPKFPTGPAEQPKFPTGPLAQFKDSSMHVDFQKLGNELRRTAKPARGKAGVSKDYVSNGKQKKSFGMQNAANLQKALALSLDLATNIQPFVPRQPKGRCKDFPYCKNRECPFSHPTKKCFAYPNCPNPPGTCDYLHPSEDGDLMAELDKTKQQFLDRKNLKFAPQVTLCKYGILCSKELCPFGHPTPANKDAKVIIQKWCRENKNCENPACEYAHSSPNYQAPPPVAPTRPPPKYQSGYNKYAAPKVPTTLEQCKFGWNCTNQLCPKRHATSQVACRAGYNCTRMDCTFNHQIDEDCRFGLECKNKPCYFRHPDGRERALFAGSDNTSGRSFAVPDDQVMEQAVQL